MITITSIIYIDIINIKVNLKVLHIVPQIFLVVRNEVPLLGLAPIDTTPSTLLPFQP